MSNDHFGGGGSTSSTGGLNAGQVNALILSASVNNITNDSKDDSLNTFAVPTFIDSKGRGVKRSRIYQDDSLNSGRVTFNQPAQSIQLPETRGLPGYALTMSRDPVLAGQGRTEWYSEAVVVPDILEVASISSLNPGVTDLFLKTPASFSGGNPVNFLQSECTNISILDAVELKATTSLQTPQISSATNELKFTNTDLTEIKSADVIGTLSANFVTSNTTVSGTNMAVVASAPGFYTRVGLFDFNTQQRGEVGANNSTIDLVAKDTRQIRLISDDSTYIVIDPIALKPVTINFDTQITGSLTVDGGITSNQISSAASTLSLTSANTQASGNFAVFGGDLFLRSAVDGGQTTFDFINLFGASRGQILTTPALFSIQAQSQLNVNSQNGMILEDPVFINLSTPSVETTGDLKAFGQINQFGAIISGGVPVLASYYRRITEFSLINTDVETNILDPTQGIGITELPPNTLQVGSSFIFSATGIASTDGKSSDITYRVKFNGITLVTTGIVTVVGDTQFHEIVIYFTVQTTGLAGSVCIVGSIRNGDAVIPLAYIASTPLNTTVMNSLEVTAQWTTAAPGDSLLLGIVNLSSI